MHAAIPQAATTFLVSAMLAAHVATRRDKSSLHWTFLALLFALLVWSGGAVWRYAAEGERELRAAFDVMFLGVHLVPPLWLLLAARLARVQRVEARPDVVAALLAPGFVLWLAFLSSPQNQWMARAIGRDVFVPGPLFWVSVAWSYACVAGGVLLFVRRARLLAGGRERSRAALLALAGLVPVAANASYVFGGVAWSHDPTPLSLGLSAALLFALVFRFGLLENLPLVRRDVLSHLREGILIADPTGSIVDANDAAERMLGRGREALRGMPLAAVLGAVVQPGDAERVEALLREGPQQATTLPRAGEVGTRDGRCLEISAAEVRGRGGDPAGRFVVLRDVTEARRFDGIVRRSQRLDSVGLLAAGIAHEVNNPLAFVQANLMHLHGLAACLAERERHAGKPDEDVVEMPHVIEETLEGVDRIARIVASMRRLSRVEEAGEGIATSVALNDVVAEAVKLAGLHRTPAVVVTTALDLELPLALGSKDRLIQVLLNLLLNAKQAVSAHGGGRVVVETFREDGAALVRVRDDGPGMDEAVQQRIFDPFFTTKGPEEGTGLGLPIAWDIVREHGGWIEVSSRPGDGACFTVRLPIASDPA